jgi:hypothetical protein
MVGVGKVGKNFNGILCGLESPLSSGLEASSFSHLVGTTCEDLWKVFRAIYQFNYNQRTDEG